MQSFWQRYRTPIIALVVILFVLAGLLFYELRANRPTDIQLSEVAQAVRSGEVDSITIAEDDLTIKYVSRLVRPNTISRKEHSATLSEQLIALGVTAEQLTKVNQEIIRPVDWMDTVTSLSLVLMPFIVAGFFIFLFRQTQGANSNAMNFGRSKARLRGANGEHPTVTFGDVAGADEAKQDLVEVVEFLKQPDKFIQLGARIPKGVLLVGAPGTGKTLLAKAVSGEAGVPFFSISGSEFVEMFVGVGASRVRDLFNNARRHSPCIIFIDEIDAVGRSRSVGVGGGHDEREQTLNQILVEMDGFDTDTNIIIIAATNRPDILDKALIRPGRFDRMVMVDAPDVKGREAILKVHSNGKPLSTDVDLSVVAKSTPGFVGADLENLVNEAAILTARRNRRSISMSEFGESIERVMIGPARKSRLISQKEKLITAYHEAGHALVGHLLPNCDPIHKVTIVSRGMAGGYTMSLPDEDRRMMSRSRFIDELAMLLGGRAAEEIVLLDITTGASNDLQRVTEMARGMVTRYGMSDAMGPVVYGQKQDGSFLGRELGDQRDYSETVALEIDREIQQLVQTAYAKAKDLINTNRSVLDALAARLMDVETVEADEFKRFFDPDQPAGTVAPPPAAPPPRPAKPAPDVNPGTGRDKPAPGGLSAFPI